MVLTEDFKDKAAETFKKTDHYEIYGVEFAKTPEEWSEANKNILQKFLTANDNQVPEALEQLQKTLEWRKEFKPLGAQTETFEDKLNKLGVVTKSPEGRIVTWNLYGAVKNPGEVFKDTETFVRWRVGLHETALSLLDFSDPNGGQIDQVHDYMNVSFWRLDSDIKRTSSKVIELFQSYYPETLSGKYFVNVPYIMMWVFKVVRALLSEATTAKFHVLANGNQLASELGGWVPKSYGGKAENLQAISIKGTPAAKEKEPVSGPLSAEEPKQEEALAEPQTPK